MTLPTTYDTDLQCFLRTFNIWFELEGKAYEVQIKARHWLEAEDMLLAIRNTGAIHSELIEVVA